MAKLLFIDTETTGDDTNFCGVYQISGIVDIDGEISEEFDLRCNIFKDDLVVQEALEKCNVKIEDIYKFDSPLKTFLNLKKILKKYVDPFKKEDKFVVIGYFADFDNRVLRRWFKKNNDEYFGSWWFHPWLDVAQIAAYVFIDQRIAIKSFKLSSVSEFAGLNFEENKLHDSLYDARLTRELYCKLTQ